MSFKSSRRMCWSMARFWTRVRPSSGFTRDRTATADTSLSVDSRARRYLNSPDATYTVPPKHLFVMGDNSRSSLDGRFWGSLPQTGPRRQGRLRLLAVHQAIRADRLTAAVLFVAFRVGRERGRGHFTLAISTGYAVHKIPVSEKVGACHIVAKLCGIRNNLVIAARQCRQAGRSATHRRAANCIRRVFR